MIMMRGGLICDKYRAGREGHWSESDIEEQASNSSSTYEFIQTPTWLVPKAIMLLFSLLTLF